MVWLYSIFLIFSIDLLEVIVATDPYVHSRLSTVAVCITLCFLIMLCLRYVDLNHFKDPHFYRAMFGLATTIVLLVLILITRVWDANNKSSLSTNTTKQASTPFYMYLYHMVLLIFGWVQLFDNAQVSIARVLTNMAYVLWLSACALQAFYLSTLPQSNK